MRRSRTAALVTISFASLIGACSDFLTGTGLSTNPNVPTTATATQLWVGVQTALVINEFEFIGSVPAMWDGQAAGVAYVQLQYANYNAGTLSYDADGTWIQTYGPGGLRDLRTIENAATADQNLKFRGQARVLEALYMGTAADIFGDVPYSAALTANPIFDSQAQVYAHVLALLDSAIDDLDGVGHGSGPTDIFYANDGLRWKAAAYSLKARFLMHTARVSAQNYDAAILDRVIAAADSGIASEAGAMKVEHDGNQTNALGVNPLYAWSMINGGIQPTTVHISLMRDAGEQALIPLFYIPNPNAGGLIVGTDPGQAGDPDSISAFNIQMTTPSYIVPYVETRMLLAEAEFRRGNEVGARTVLNDYRASVSTASLALSGDSLLVAILREKYIHDFISLEAWNDYLRTCYPNIALPLHANTNQPYVPARLPVGYTEQITNPNVPPQPNGNPGNPNDPKNDFAVDGTTSCYGQVQRPY